MPPFKVRQMRNILMELRKVCQHPYLAAPELENLEIPEEEQHKQLTGGSGKLAFLKVLLPKLKERGHRVLLFSQFKIALDRIEDFLYGEGYKYLRLDGDVQQAKRQKSMDAFNAPGSDYFIFLLTTRAGGVGINLATADTVIVHDPDFNPHQDQQAIARAHRYGQKKPVMVFKLMTKNSVEERIIEKTKKKLVLDHLVVQNLHRDNDEGEIDDMILHGAKALYDTDADGRAASDINYTSKMVDELIDKVEREAQDEMLAAVARDRAKEEGAEGEGGAVAEKPKEFMSFGFAKIWEAGKNELADLEEEAEPNEEEEIQDQAEAWEKLLESARTAEQKRLLQEDAARAARSRRHNLKYQPDGIFSDESPAKKKKGRPRKDGKLEARPDSDGDFALPIDFTAESDSDATMSDEAEVLQDAHGNLISVPGGKHKYTEAELAEWNAAKAASKAAARGRVVAPAGSGTVPPPNAVAGPSKKPVASETKEEQKARRAARKEAKKREQEARGAEIKAATAADPSGLSTTTKHSKQSTTHRLINETKIDSARSVLQWLYQTFDEVGLSKEKKMWANLGVLEFPVDQRKQMYQELAKSADDIFLRLGQPHYFTTTGAISKVMRLIESGVSIIPDRLERMPDLPFEPAPPVIPAVERLSSKGATAPGPSRSSDAAPPDIIQAKTDVPPTAPAIPPPLPEPIAQETSTAKPPRSSPTAERTPSSKKRTYCSVCREPHPFNTCKRVPPVKDLLKYQRALRDSREDQTVIAEAMQRVNDMLRLHEKYGHVSTNRDDSTSQRSAASERADGQVLPARKRQSSGNETFQDATEADAPAQKKTRIDLSSGVSTFASSQPKVPPQTTPSRSQPQLSPLASTLVNGSANGQPTPVKSPGRGRQKTFHGCSICGGPKFHIAAECPVVLAGPESIARALRQFKKTDAQYNILQHLYKKAKRCAFCAQSCQRTIRECAEVTCGGSKQGRKALKDLIRKADSEREGVYESEERERLDDRMAQLYDAYRAWPK